MDNPQENNSTVLRKRKTTLKTNSSGENAGENAAVTYHHQQQQQLGQSSSSHQKPFGKSAATALSAKTVPKRKTQLQQMGTSLNSKVKVEVAVQNQQQSPKYAVTLDDIKEMLMSINWAATSSPLTDDHDQLEAQNMGEQQIDNVQQNLNAADDQFGFSNIEMQPIYVNDMLMEEEADKENVEIFVKLLNQCHLILAIATEHIQHKSNKVPNIPMVLWDENLNAMSNFIQQNGGHLVGCALVNNANDLTREVAALIENVSVPILTKLNQNAIIFHDWKSLNARLRNLQFYTWLYGILYTVLNKTVTAYGVADKYQTNYGNLIDFVLHIFVEMNRLLEYVDMENEKEISARKTVPRKTQSQKVYGGIADKVLDTLKSICEKKGKRRSRTINEE
ncbi:hypothetical protein niasHS_004241 [Heterodera schachtii]|uniref:Uncharacterized protein n=1 Tax=Heterodera schachtii TaxID=97005 RepID=A0ABD2JNS7_HETSC